MTLPVDQSFLGWSTAAFRDDAHVVVSEYLLIFTLLVVSAIVVAHVICDVWKWKFVPEAAVLTVVGMLISLIIRLCGGYTELATDTATAYSSEEASFSFNPKLLGFSPTIFFFGFLPPIIFSSGYHLKRKLFFRNFGAILLMALLGTCVSTAVVGCGLYFLPKLLPAFLHFHMPMSFVECICFGSLISSTDPVSTLAVFSSLRVDPSLFYLVFGESVLNDAVAITVFNVTSKFVGYSMTAADGAACVVRFIICFVGSCIIGYILGLFTALLFKYLDFHGNRIVSVAVLTGTVYLPFFLAETLQLSGIVAILFSGIAARRYAAKNLTLESSRFASLLFRWLAYLAESSCFVLIGLSVFSLSWNQFHWDLILVVLLLCAIGRASHVYPFLSLINCFRARSRPLSASADVVEGVSSPDMNGYPRLIPASHMHMLFFAGLRGAVAFSCANIFSDRNGNRVFVVATSTAVVMATLFLLGGATEPLLKRLSIATNVDTTSFVQQIERSERNTDNDRSHRVTLATCFNDNGTTAVTRFGKDCLSQDPEQHFVYPLVLRRRKLQLEERVDSGDCPENHEETKRKEYFEGRDLEASSGGGSCRTPSPNLQRIWNFTSEGLREKHTGGCDVQKTPLADEVGSPSAFGKWENVLEELRVSGLAANDAKKEVSGPLVETSALEAIISNVCDPGLEGR